MEIVAQEATKKELDDKQTIYEQMGVAEFFVFGPSGVTVGTMTGHRLQGKVLRKGR